MLATESPEVFVGFGATISAPASGTVVAALDGEPDYEARRSQLALIPYAVSQARRVRQGVRAIAGNHVVIAMGPSGPFVLIAHLRRGSVRVTVGSAVEVGDIVGSWACATGRQRRLPLSAQP
jgi:murein DD-endopeptidase MepM/ murein hydrolase activator NlpD